MQSSRIKRKKKESVISNVFSFSFRNSFSASFLLQNIGTTSSADILSVPTGNDFITFKTKPTEPIAEHRKYHGVSTQITGYIKNIRVPFNVDVGVGDVIIPSAETRVIRTQLDNFDSPEIVTYSLESTVAEKLDAILQRFELTGRMKDFYDIYYLSQTFEFDGQKLQTAIHETLSGCMSGCDKLQREGQMPKNWYVDKNAFLSIMKTEKEPR